jgi:hypothetical protein
VHSICIGIDMAQINIQDQLLAFDSHFRPQATSNKQQATSCKRQATSYKRQALDKVK